MAEFFPESGPRCLHSAEFTVIVISQAEQERMWETQKSGAAGSHIAGVP